MIYTASISAETLSPERYREEVKGYSWDIKSAEVAIDSAESYLAYEKVARLPNLSSAGRFTYNLHNQDETKDWFFYLEPQIIQTIYGGGVARADIKGARLKSEIARYTADYTTLEVYYTADYAYWSLWAMSRYREAIGEYVSIIRSEVEAISRRYEEGYIAKGDLLMISARLSEAEYSLTSADGDRLIALNTLNILRGATPDEEVTLISIDNSSLPPLIERVEVADLVARRPDYTAQLLSEGVAHASTQATRGAYNPQLKGGATGSWRTLTPNASGATQLGGTLFVELSMPIYHFGERRKAVSVSRAAERTTQIESAIALDAIVKSESSAWITLVESRAQVEAASRSLSIASENLEISTYSYNEGEVSIVELIQAQISWIDIYTNAIKSRYNYQVAIAYYYLTVGGYF